MLRFALSCVLFAACTKPNPNATCANGTCGDPGFPYCDVNGLIDGEPGVCIAVSCSPGSVGACHGDNALVCNQSGNGYEEQPCSIGCMASATPHCRYLQPRYAPDICDTRATSDSLAFTNSGSFDPNLDANCNGGVLPQTGAPGLCVAHYGSISVSVGATVTIVGNGTALGRPLALVADDLASIAGTIDASAHGNKNGPGGGILDSGGLVNGNGNGGGGAGGATAGGAGATPSTDGGAANGGPASGNPALLTALVGGACHERSNTPPDQEAMFMAGGGGAITIISCHGTVMLDGLIDVGGGGGFQGFHVFGSIPGNGGGAGGYVVLQGVTVNVTGQVFANGGGGGGGMQSSQAAGLPGQDGPLSDVFPAQGGSPQSDEGAGGVGGINAAFPGAGKHPSAAGATPGGGGGSVGFLQTYTPDGVTPMLAPSHASPAFQPNGTVPTR